MKTDLMMFGRTVPFQSFFLFLDRELWLLRPCPVWLTPPSSPDRTRSVSMRRVAGRGRRDAWKWWTRPDTSLDTSTQGHTRRRFKNPCEILHPAVNAKPNSKAQRDFFWFPVEGTSFFLWITLSLCSSSFKCFITFNWNAVYIQTLTSPAGTFLTNMMMPRERQHCTLY